MHLRRFFDMTFVILYDRVLTQRFRKPCGIRAARKLRVVRRQERWADKVCSIFVVADGIEVQEGPQYFFD